MSKLISSLQVYDNIAIGSLVIDKVIQSLCQISLAKSILILPLLLHDPVIKRLSTAAKYRSIDEFLIKERINLGDINLRTDNMLSLSVNCISVLQDLKRIEQRGNILVSLTKLEEPVRMDIGQRATKILKIIEKSNFLFNEDDTSTYLKFNITL